MIINFGHRESCEISTVPVTGYAVSHYENNFINARSPWRLRIVTVAVAASHTPARDHIHMYTRSFRSFAAKKNAASIQ